MRMKGLSVLLTLALLILAHQLPHFLQRNGALPLTAAAHSPPLGTPSEMLLLARTNSRNVAPSLLPTYRAQGGFIRRHSPLAIDSDNPSFEL